MVWKQNSLLSACSFNMRFAKLATSSLQTHSVGDDRRVQSNVPEEAGWCSFGPRRLKAENSKDDGTRSRPCAAECKGKCTAGSRGEEEVIEAVSNFASRSMFGSTIFRKELEFSLESTSKRLQSSEEEVQQLKKHVEDNKCKHRDEMSKLKSELEEKSKSLREFHVTVKTIKKFQGFKLSVVHSNWNCLVHRYQNWPTNWTSCRKISRLRRAVQRSSKSATLTSLVNKWLKIGSKL